jgi:putative addiction module antidote
MASITTVRKIGDSVGVILDKDVAEALGVQAGDTLFIVQTGDGVRLTPYDPDFAEAMEAGRDYMRRHRNALKELAR